MRFFGKLLLWVCAAIGGLMLTVVLAVVAFTATVADRPPDLPDAAYLTLDWREPLTERHATLPAFKRFPDATLLDTVMALGHAAETPEVKGLVVYLGGTPIDFARAQELADPVRAFGASGKPTLAFAADLGVLQDGTPEMLLASAFDEIWLQPSGIVGLTGVVFEVPYFAEGLDGLGVAVESEQRHEFKGGIDPLTHTRMPAPVRQSLQGLANGLLEQSITAIASGRGLPVEVVRDLVNSGPHLAHEARDAGLVDRLAYLDAFDAMLDSRFGNEAVPIDVPLYLAATTPDQLDEVGPLPRVAVLYGIGPIGVDSGEFGDPGFDSEGLVETLLEIADSESHDAVLFRIDSPGGVYGPSDAVWQAVRKVSDAGIPVVASMGGMAASGGYFVAASADRIIAQPGTITGSIGVYGIKFDASGFWDNLGVRWDRVSAGRNAGMQSFNRALDPAERARFAAAIDFVYEDFTTKVGQGRGLDAAQLDAAARGRLWLGETAMGVGLVDRVGGFPVALAETRNLLGIDPEAPLDIMILPEPQSPWDFIIEAAEEGKFSIALSALVADAVERRVMARLKTVLGDLDNVLIPRGLLSAPPIRFRH